MRLSRFYIVDEFWIGIEAERKVLVNLMKDEKLMGIIGVDHV